jgi:hypothetical protein
MQENTLTTRDGYEVKDGDIVWYCQRDGKSDYGNFKDKPYRLKVDYEWGFENCFRYFKTRKACKDYINDAFGRDFKVSEESKAEFHELMQNDYLKHLSQSSN